MEISTERVSIPLAGGGSMGGYLARPKTGGPSPAVLVYMEIFGVNRTSATSRSGSRARATSRSRRITSTAPGRASSTATTTPAWPAA